MKGPLGQPLWSAGLRWWDPLWVEGLHPWSGIERLHVVVDVADANHDADLILMTAAGSRCSIRPVSNHPTCIGSFLGSLCGTLMMAFGRAWRVLPPLQEMSFESLATFWGKSAGGWLGLRQ